MSDSLSLLGKTVSHYQVVEIIGAGGMGVVYRAHDKQLDRDVALKVLPVGTLTDEDARKQFRKEALALAKLNHPNVETVYEFASHDGMDFLAMELIEGETLRAKLRHGPLDEQDVLRLCVQLSDGLAAAHEKGIIHRDLKPGNLIVTPDNRLKILDFGLAKLIQPELALDLTQSVTVDSGKVSGTLPYMSPEQLSGKSVDPRSDIFAAGAVMYEMATGRRPFPQLQSAELMGAILHKVIDSPTSLNPEVSPGLERIICKTLEKEPVNRYHTARELRAALDGISGVSTSGSFSPTGHRSVALKTARPSSLFHYGWAAGATVFLLIFAVGLYIGLHPEKIRARLVTGKRSEDPTTTPIKSRPSVAVLGFKNVSGHSDQAWVSTAISEMLTTELAAGEQLRTVSGEDVARMKTSLSLPETDSYGQETLQRIHANLDTDIVVLGSYVILRDGQVRLDLRLQDALRGVTLASVSEKGREDQIDELVSNAGAKLRQKLNVGAVTPSEEAELKATLPTSPDALRLYAQGIAKLRSFDNVAARDLLQKAVLEDPNLALAHSALASAYSNLGYDEKARQSARNAFELSSKLSREDRLLVEARYRETNKEWQHAIEGYRVLFGFFPDNLEYGILLAGVEIHGGAAKEALNTLESLRRLPLPARLDPRIDLKVAEAYVSLGEFVKSQPPALAAASKAKASASNLVLADSLFLQAEAFETLNQPTEAQATVDEAQQIYRVAGDRRGEAKSMEVRANILADKSEFAAAISEYKRQLAIAREIGNRRLEISALNNMAIVLKGQGDPEGARHMWEQALLGFRDISDKANSAAVLVNIGGVFLDEGDLIAAKKIYEQAISISQEVNDQNGISTATAGVGTVLDAQGDLPGAEKMLDHAIEIDLSGGLKSAPPDKLVDLGDVLQHQGNLLLASNTYRDALAQSRDAGDKSDAAYALMGLGNIAFEGGDFKEARKNYDEASTIRTELGEKKNLAVTQMALAEVNIEEGQSAEVILPIKKAIEDLRNSRARDDELVCAVILVRAFLSQGNIVGAIRELNLRSGLAAKDQNPATKMNFEITAARLEAVAGKNNVADDRLRRALGKAVKLGLIKTQLECRLAIEELAPQAGKSPEATARRTQLEREATERGFVRIARKVSALTKA
jgi:eukaryotic-like serine/threonine-protein kinase